MKILNIFRKIPVTPEERKARIKQRILAVLSGLMLGLSFPPIPFPFTLLAFIGLIPYFQGLNKKDRLIDINRFTYLTAFVFNLLTIYWVGGWGAETDPFLMIAGGLLLFINPVFFLIPSTLYYFAKKIFNKKLAYYLFPFFWVTYEFLYMVTDASFPWVTLGNGLVYFNTFIQIADMIGALGLTLILIYINLFLFKFLEVYRTQGKIAYNFGIIAVILFGSCIIYGVVRLSTFNVSNKSIKIGLIQPNINPWDKWSGGDLHQLTGNYLKLSQEAVKKGAEFIVWPETALPVYLRNGSHEDIIDSLNNFTRMNDVYLLTGMPDFVYYPSKDTAPEDAKYNERFDYYYTTYNSVLFFSPYSNKIERYGKMKLVPFGERVPFVDVLPFLGNWIRWNVGLSGWNIGRDTIVFSLVNKIKSSSGAQVTDTIKVTSLVCFESVFPAFVAGFTQKGAEIITVVTNDSWYGNSSGPYQHKEIGVIRAVENRRTVLRAANGGISTIIDPLGRTVIESKMYTKDVIVGDASIEDDLTFFSKYPLLIPLISVIISMIIIILFFLNKILYKFSGKRLFNSQFVVPDYKLQ